MGGIIITLTGKGRGGGGELLLCFVFYLFDFLYKVFDIFISYYVQICVFKFCFCLFFAIKSSYAKNSCVLQYE